MDRAQWSIYFVLHNIQYEKALENPSYTTFQFNFVNYS